MMATMVPAFAAGSGYDINITNNDQIAAHTYTAYKVFGGTLNANKDGLGDVVWANDTQGAALVSALKTDTAKLDDGTTAISAKFPNASYTAKEVSEILNANKDDKAFMERFAELAALNFTTSAGASTETTSPYKINVTDPGYYLVKDTGTIADGDTATSIMLQVVGDVNVTAKSVTVPNEKKIVEGTDLVDSNTAAVGDTVNYVITSKIPDVTHYEKFYFIVHDTMSTGLTFDGTVTAEYGTLEGTTFTKADDIPASSLDILTKDTNPAADSGDTFTVVVKDAKTLFTGKNGKTIRFYYSATVNQSAAIGTTGNTNQDEIEYSNNPNVKPNGENKPGSGDTDVTGKTGKDQVITYVAGLEILKIDGTTKTPLKGAEFTITATELNQIKKVTKDTFVVADDGEYWALKDGSYTTTDPDTATLSDAAKAKYTNDGKKYKPTTQTNWETVAVATPKVTETLTVGDDGVLHIEGLNAGTYTLKETKAPAGYNLLTDDIVIKITASTPGTVSSLTDPATWSYTTKIGDGAESESKTATNAIAAIEVENNSGAVLPSTGGIGTTIFYIAGSILVLAAAILLITKRRMGNND